MQSSTSQNTSLEMEVLVIGKRKKEIRYKEVLPLASPYRSTSRFRRDHKKVLPSMIYWVYTIASNKKRYLCLLETTAIGHEGHHHYEGLRYRASC